LVTKYKEAGKHLGRLGFGVFFFLYRRESFHTPRIFPLFYNLYDFESENQCLGSGSVGSARFWPPGSKSGSAKICGSMDPDPRGKISTKNDKKNFYS